MRRCVCGDRSVPVLEFSLFQNVAIDAQTHITRAHCGGISVEFGTKLNKQQQYAPIDLPAYSVDGCCS